MLAQRRCMGVHQQQSASNDIAHALYRLDVFKAAQFIALYSARDNEVLTDGIFTLARSEGKKVVYPSVCSGRLLFREVGSLDDLCLGTYGIPEPACTAPIIETPSLDLVVVPGVAFDLRGHRIGYGKGYYDKTFHSCEGQGKLLGICYDFQLVEQIGNEPHDVEMDMILTEKRFVATRNLP